MEWACLSNHGLVLVSLAEGHPHRIRDLARRVDLTERAVQRIVTELVSAGLVNRQREGRCNTYTLNRTRPLRHPLEAHCTVGDVIDTFATGHVGNVDTTTAMHESDRGAA